MVFNEVYRRLMVREAEMAKHERFARLLIHDQRQVVAEILGILPDVNSRTRVLFGGQEALLLGQVVDSFLDGQVVGEKIDLILTKNGSVNDRITGFSGFVANELFLMTNGGIRTSYVNPIYSILESPGEHPTRVILSNEMNDDSGKIKAAANPGNLGFVKLSL